MNRIEKLMTRIASGETILLDGATGTELERRNVPMTDGAWNSLCVATHPDIVRQLHADYIDMGAQIIITNTFSSNRYVLEKVGHEDKFEFLNRHAAELCVEARDQMKTPDVIVAGGMSLDSFGKGLPSKEQAAIDYAQQAAALVAGGCDIIILEMMWELTYTQILIEAAQKTGVPVWVGFTCKIEDGVPMLEEDGVPMLKGEGSLEAGLAMISKANIPVVAIMHTLTEDIEPCLDVIEANWQKPVCVYAHSGRFVQPNWVFKDVISAENYATEAKKWQARGVSIIGGCCGIGCEHIEMLSKTLL